MHPDIQRVMLLDDHPIVLEGLQQRLAAAPHLQVVGAYNTGSALMQALTAATEPVHLAIVDFSLGPDEVDGIKLLRALRVRFPRTAVLVLSSHYNPATVSLALQAGAHGFLSKTQGAEALLDAIRQILAGRTYLPEDMRQQLSELSRQTPVPGATPGRVAEALTPREQEVLRCTLEGMSPSEISAKFSRAISTISTQKKSGFQKLGIRNDAELFKVRSLIEKS
jgi:two-component system, NarL family, captular synthesis response regulator RcsB